MADFKPVACRIWPLILLFAVGLLAWSSEQRIQRVDQVASTDAEDRAIDRASPTGYDKGKRWLIVSEQDTRSYQWIEETQQMFARGEMRVRHVDYENAPLGRPVYSASLYRWWFGAIAKFHQIVTGQPIGYSVERAALFADPLLHFLLVVLTTLFIWRFWRGRAAAFFCLAAVSLYPLAGAFLPGAPDDHGLTWILGLGSILPLLAAMYPGTHYPNEKPVPANEGRMAKGRTNTLFGLAGLIGGFGLWLNAAEHAAILSATFVGALLALATIEKTDTAIGPWPWRLWATVGAATSLLAYGVEYLPTHLQLRLLVNHPLYALAWLGAGELLAQGESWRRGRGRAAKKAVTILRIAFAVLALAALPVALIWREKGSFFQIDEYGSRLSFLLNGVVAKNVFAWIARDGLSAALLATVLPAVVLLGRTLFLLFSRSTTREEKAALALSGGAALSLAIYASFRIREWNACDALLLALLPMVLGKEKKGAARWWELSAAAVVFIPGLLLLTPPRFRAANTEFSLLEVQGLLERQLAHWVTDNAEPGTAVVLLPPERTTSWVFHGGFKGLGTANWENRDGIEATMRIATATSADEALGLITQHGLTHLILPSWDNDLDAFARWRLTNPEDAFVMALHHWSLPPWLQAVPYRMPKVPHFASESVVILKVTEETNRVTALSRLAEYFVESERMDLATAIREVLSKYPSDLSALIALASVEKARSSPDELGKAVEAILASVSAGGDRSLPWDRRVSLAVVLAQAGKTDLARQQVQRTLERLNEARIRSLTTTGLFRLQALAKAFNLPIADPHLRTLALDLLPKPLRERL